MEVYLNITAEYGDKQIKQHVGLVNGSIENHGLFQKEIPGVVDTHLKEVNVLLNSSKTRNQGFQLLLPVIQQGSQQVLEKRCDLWFGICSQAVVSFCGADEKKNACKIITVFLRAAHTIPEVQKVILARSPASLIQSLASADSSWNCAALECLYEFVKHYPGHCLSQKAVIEERMLKYLDSPLAKVGQEDVVKRAGQVFAALPLPGMGGVKAQGRAEARGRQVAELIALAHNTMDALFDGIVEKETYKQSKVCKLKILPIEFQGDTSTDTVRGFLASVTRLGNTLKFLSEMLTSDSNESIYLVPYDTLGAIFRLLQVDSSVLKSYKSQEHQLLALLISSLHHYGLLLLKDLILSIGECIDLYYGVIGGLLLSVIKMSFTSDESAWCSSGLMTRIIAYSVMATVLQASSGRHTPPKELVTMVLRDVIPKSQQVTLQKTQGKGLSSLTVQKKKKKKGYTIDQSTSTNQAGPMFQLEPLSRVTRAALLLVETLFSFASHSLPHKTKQILQTTIMNVTESVTCGATVPEAYTNGKTRAQMYRALTSMATHPDPRCPPPYTMILSLLQHGQQDQQMLVSSTCQTLLGNVSFIVANPQISEMSLALQQSQISNGTEDAEEDAENYTTRATMNQSENAMHVSDDDDEKEENDGIGDDDGDDDEENDGIDDDDDEEDNDDTEDMNETKESVGLKHPTEVVENGGNVTDEEEAKELTTPEDSEDEQIENGIEEISVTEDAAAPVAKTEINRSKTNTEQGDVAFKDVKLPLKRKNEEESSSILNNKKTNISKPTDGLTLEEMMSSFVDAPPDE